MPAKELFVRVGAGFDPFRQSTRTISLDKSRIGPLRTGVAAGWCALQEIGTELVVIVEAVAVEEALREAVVKAEPTAE